VLLLSECNFIQSDNKEATNRSLPVSKGGDVVVEKETVRAVFFCFLVIGCLATCETSEVISVGNGMLEDESGLDGGGNGSGGITCDNGIAAPFFFFFLDHFTCAMMQ
jgi:hypothetical protein